MASDSNSTNRTTRTAFEQTVTTDDPTRRALLLRLRPDRVKTPEFRFPERKDNLIAPNPPTILDVNESYFESGPMQLKSAHSDRAFYIHEDVLKRSSSALYAACSRMWKEGQNRVYQFDAVVSEQVIACFLNYAYVGDYYATGNRPTSAAEKLRTDGKCTSLFNAEENVEDTVDPLLLHAQIYVFADTYLMPDLCNLAAMKLKNSLVTQWLDSDEVQELILELFEYAKNNFQRDDRLLVFLAEHPTFRGARYMLGRVEDPRYKLDVEILEQPVPEIGGSSEDLPAPSNTADGARMPPPLSEPVAAVIFLLILALMIYASRDS